MNTTNGSVRWLVNFQKWNPSQEEWEAALSLVEPEEKQRIERFKRPQGNGVYLVGRQNDSAKSSLIGRLLIKKLVEQELQTPYLQAGIGRTPEKKPYLVKELQTFVNQNSQITTKFPHFNFNVSHAGEYVAIGSEPFLLIGVDVMEMAVPNNRNKDHEILDFFKSMQDCFTPFEWQNIRYSSNLQDQVKQFFRHWTLKEAYIKAVGIGLGFELQRAEFTLNSNENPTLATVRIDGKERPDWKFDIQHTPDNHVVSTALGPPNQAIQSYLKAVSVPNLPLDFPATPMQFSILQAKDLY